MFKRGGPMDSLGARCYNRYGGVRTVLTSRGPGFNRNQPFESMIEEEIVCMEDQFIWRDEYNVGVEVIDKEHQRLFKIIHKLLAFGEEEEINPRACQEGVKYFKGHALKHFTEEEEYMASIRYEGIERHRRIHQGFRENTLPALEAELERTNYAPEAIDHFLGVCTGWLVGHTLTEDQAITGGHGSNWGALLSQEQQADISRAIAKLMSDMFHLEPQVISDTYSGEKFGKGIYYRLTYAMGGKKRQEVLLAFEEKLLLNTVGKIMGQSTKKLDPKLVHAARYAIRQFVGRVMERMHAAAGWELKEENLLAYEVFQEVFQREQPQVSLLFNTGGKGYFSYSVIAPEIPEEYGATAIEAHNAVEEIENFLQQREEEHKQASPKKKVLVVDDSLTIRQGMQALLSPDYDVSLASSGAGAIRAITLNKPHLVLLDYEMPVCDGRQTLEMLRAEPDFAGLPVFFLTGRRDRETMIKVMPLNPSGYLLKYLKPAEIKQKIDDFFARAEG